MLSTFTAFFDSNVFVGTRLRSLILFLAQSGHFRARWSDDVHREWMAAVLRNRPSIREETLVAQRRLMDAAVLNCKVNDYETLIPGLTLPDSDDRHILAAAIKSSASVIVTFNERDFPAATLETYGLHARHPDQFIVDLEGLDADAFIGQVRKDWRHYRAPAIGFRDYVRALHAAGVPKTADLLTRLEILFGESPYPPAP